MGLIKLIFSKASQMLNAKNVLIALGIAGVLAIAGVIVWLWTSNSKLEAENKNQKIIIATYQNAQATAEKTIAVKTIVQSKPNRTRDELIARYERGER